MNRRIPPVRLAAAAMSIALWLSLGVGASPQNATVSNGAITGSISGRITQPDGSPLAGARVAALSDPTSPATESALISIGQTNADGRYRLDDIPPGRYYIVTGPLDVPVYFPGIHSKAEAGIVTVVAGTVLEGRDFHLQPPSHVTISGRVIRDGHSAGTWVTLTRPGTARVANPPPQVIANVIIAADGKFEFDNVAPGVYTAFVGPNLDDLAAFPLTIEDKDVTGLNWVIPAAWVKRAPVRFTIRMDCDCRASSVWLKLTPSGSNADSAASRSWDYPLAEPSEVVPVPVGEYHVAVEYKEAAWTPIPVGLAVTAITAGAADLTVTPLQVTAKDPPDVTIHIGLPRREPWVRIKGQVTGLNTASVKATSITLVDGPMRSPIEARINADGTFEFPKVLPGLYVGQLNPGADPFPRTLRVEKSGLRDVKIPMEIPVRKVSGRIKDLTDYVLNRKATVSVMLLDMQLKSRNVNLTDTQLKSGVSTDGTFAFNAVPPGSYQVYVEVCGELCYLASKTRLKVADKDTHNLELPALKSAEQRLRR